MERWEIVRMENPSPEKVYVAAGRSFSENEKNLRTVLENFPGQELVILHVHKPSTIVRELLGGIMPVSLLPPHELNKLKRSEWDELQKTINLYLDVCTTAKVKAEMMILELNKASRGIIELIERHHIRNLVIGAASDGNYCPYELAFPLPSSKPE